VTVMMTVMGMVIVGVMVANRLFLEAAPMGVAMAGSLATAELHCVAPRLDMAARFANVQGAVLPWLEPWWSCWDTGWRWRHLQG